MTEETDAFPVSSHRSPTLQSAVSLAQWIRKGQFGTKDVFHLLHIML